MDRIYSGQCKRPFHALYMAIHRIYCRWKNISVIIRSQHCRVKTGFQIPSSELNLYANDMYLMPIADSLPTYEQHVLQQQQLQKDRILQHEKPTHLSPTSYNGVHFISSKSKQNGTIQTAITSPNQGLTRCNGSNPMSPSSKCSRYYIYT
jgi:hypothetical protein